VPVIIGKEKKHPFVRGVYEGVTTKMIMKYLSDNQKDSYYKILTTPESFKKVKKAIRNVNMEMYKDFFLLFDECEKIIQDMDYRKNIALPIDDFFRFENKAMVSATALIPSDPRFEQQGFILKKIVPNFAHAQKIVLYPTNNVRVTLKMALQALQEADKTEEDKICIFFNSINCIENLVTFLKIKGKSNIYCSTDSLEKLKNRGFKNVFDNLATREGEINFNKYNFFTSRFYSAVDIELPYKPNVIMITDIYAAPHTTIDPETEAVQIAGRFRNGIKNLVHITNYNRKLEYKEPDVLSIYLAEQHEVYTKMLEMYNDSEGLGEMHILQQALGNVDYSRFITEKGKKDYFMYDNAFRDEYVKGLYVQPIKVKNSYVNTGKFEVTYKYINSALSDTELKELKSNNISKKDLNKLVYKIIKQHLKLKNDYDNEYVISLSKSYKLIFEAIEVLGETELLETGFNEETIKTAIANKKASNKMRSKGVIVAVHKAFSENTWYRTSKINAKLKAIFTYFDLPTDGRGIAPKIKLYFEAEKDRKGAVRGWKLTKKIY